MDNMRKSIYSVFLFCLEVFLYYIVVQLLNIPTVLAIKYGSIWFILVFMFKHYRLSSTLVWNEIRSLGKIFIIYVLISCVNLYPQFLNLIKVIGAGFFMFALSLLISRTTRILFRNKLAKRTLVIGTGRRAYRIGQIAHNNRYAVTKVIGYVKMGKNVHTSEILDEEDKEVFEYKDLEKVIKEEKIDQVIIAIPNSSKDMIDEVTRKIFNKVRYIKIAPNLDFTMTFNSSIEDFDGELLISTSRGKMNFISRFFKRMIDICAGLAGCLLLVPLTLYVKYKNKKEGDTDPIFFTQERIGLNGKPIHIYKYRSMVPNAEQLLEDLMEKDPEIREEYLTNKKLRNDPRITKVGEALRKRSLDEFPQFINVLKGEMSLVGPRPYLPREKEDMDIFYNTIIKSKPGITGMWQANGRSDVSFEDRCKFDDYYYKNWSIGLDVIIVYKTIKGVLYGRGAL